MTNLSNAYALRFKDFVIKYFSVQCKGCPKVAQTSGVIQLIKLKTHEDENCATKGSIDLHLNYVLK